MIIMKSISCLCLGLNPTWISYKPSRHARLYGLGERYSAHFSHPNSGSKNAKLILLSYLGFCNIQRLVQSLYDDCVLEQVSSGTYGPGVTEKKVVEVSGNVLLYIHGCSHLGNASDFCAAHDFQRYQPEQLTIPFSWDWHLL